MRETSPNALVFNGRSSPALKCPATTRPGPRRRNVFLSRTLPNYFGFHEGNSPTSTHTCGVVYLHSVARGGGKPFASPSPGKSSHCTHALLFRTTMTAFPPNGHVLYKDLPTPYQLSGNNSWARFCSRKQPGIGKLRHAFVLLGLLGKNTQVQLKLRKLETPVF